MSPTFRDVNSEKEMALTCVSEAGDYAATTVEEWTSILHLSTQWMFSSIRAIAAREVFLLASATERVALGRKYGFESWLMDAFVEVCERPDALSLQEARRMSVEDYVGVSQAREAIHIPRVSLDLAQKRAIVSRIFDLHDHRLDPEGDTASARKVSDVSGPSQVRPSGSSDLSSLSHGDNFVVGSTHVICSRFWKHFTYPHDAVSSPDELVIHLSMPIRRIRVHTGWAVRFFCTSLQCG